MSILHPAFAALLMAASGATAAAEPVRIQPTIVPMLQTAAAKAGDATAGKPAPMPRVPGPVVSTHVHANADGTREIRCSVDHGVAPGGDAGAVPRDARDDSEVQP